MFKPLKTMIIITILLILALPAWSKTAQEWFKEGLVYFDKENYQEAIECFDCAIKVDPNYVDAWYKKGVAIYQSKGSVDDELDCYNKIIEINPNYAKAWYAKGWALYDLGRIEEAKECCSKAKALSPNTGYVWYATLNKTSTQNTSTTINNTGQENNSSGSNYTVYITNTGECYHRSGCSSLRKSCTPINISDAISQGYTPCSKCNP